MFTKKPERDSENTADPPPVDQSAAKEDASEEMHWPLKKAEPARNMGNMAPSIIGEDLSVTGNIVSKGEVQIEGELEGDVHCSSVVVGDKATVTGGVVAEDVVVRGRVVGSVRGNRVTLQSSSHVEGDIYHQSLASEQGAFFEGKSRRADDPAAEPADTASAKPASSSQAQSSAKSGSDSASKAPRAAE
jgi:cytoskeletal protein CcmA (bactofilin family)